MYRIDLSNKAHNNANPARVGRVRRACGGRGDWCAVTRRKIADYAVLGGDHHLTAGNEAPNHSGQLGQEVCLLPALRGLKENRH